VNKAIQTISAIALGSKAVFFTTQGKDPTAGVAPFAAVWKVAK